MQVGRSAIVNHAGCSVLCFASHERCKTVQRSYAVHRGAMYRMGTIDLYFGPFCVCRLTGLKAILRRRVQNTTRNIIRELVSRWRTVVGSCEQFINIRVP